MNKDLLLIFVIGPLIVEIGKAVIKEIHDRRATSRAMHLATSGNFRSLITDIEHSLADHVDGARDMHSHLFKLMALTSEIVSGATVPVDVKEEYLKFRRLVGTSMFGDRSDEERAELGNQISQTSKSLLNKSWNNASK